MTPERIVQLAQTMGMFLHGHPPEVQSAVLAELFSLWLAGHRPDVRGEARAMHDKLVDELIVVNAKKLWGE